MTPTSSSHLSMLTPDLMNWQTWRIGQEGITLPSTPVSHRKLFSMTGGGSVAFNIRYCYLVSTVSSRSRFLELLYRVASQSVDMSTTLSHFVHKSFRPCEYYGHMAWQPAVYTWFSTPLSLRNSPTLHHRGRPLRRPRIVNDWKRSFVAASVLDFALLITYL